VDIVTPQPAAEARPAFRGQEDDDQHRHAPYARQHRERGPTALSQLAKVELPACLQPDHEKEEGHQAAVDPLAQGQGEADVSEPDRQGCLLRLPW